MRTFSQRPDKFVFSVITMILFASTIWICSFSALPQQQTSLGVKITNPVRGQQVAIGKNLTLSGGNDFSKWNYTFTPAYAATIREGINRITAKLLCQANPANLTKFYSINVTGMNGILPKHSAIIRNNTAVAPLSSNSSSSLFYQTPLINHLSLPTNSNSSAPIASSGSHYHSIYGKDHFNGSHCNYSDYKRNIISCS
jgi:hypothetical protein